VSEFSELLSRAQRGERGAMGLLLERFRGDVRRAAHGGLGPDLRPRFDTEDIVQSVFGDVVREVVRVEDRGEWAFRAWLATRVRRKLCTKARRQVLRSGLRKEVPLAPGREAVLLSRWPEPGEEAARREEAARLRHLLGTLESDDRAVIGLRVHEGLPWAEVAERLGLGGADAARMRYVRVLEALRNRWNPV
jgi:RNA polymerase sigma factor (sigma-70 family)